ncbi:MAG: hypothetical protein H6618_04660 [Deltaproteobacteria bacterium]|nr:hypothetical protein [Deltaproteobacteria bacterium]
MKSLALVLPLFFYSSLAPGAEQKMDDPLGIMAFLFKDTAWKACIPTIRTSSDKLPKPETEQEIDDPLGIMAFLFKDTAWKACIPAIQATASQLSDKKSSDERAKRDVSKTKNHKTVRFLLPPSA